MLFLLILFIILLTLGGLIWLADRRLQQQAHDEARMLLNSAVQFPEPAVFRHSDLADLPQPVQRYLRRSVPDGSPLIRTVYLRQTGQMSPGGGDQWLPFQATQYFCTQPAGFVWLARARLLFLLWIAARDKYINGHGNMLIKPASLLTMADESGPSMDQGALARYLAETMWFPTALLPNDNLHWRAVDDHAAAATYRDQYSEATLTFTFNDLGDLIQVEGLRLRDQDAQPLPWGGKVLAYDTFAGVRVPSQVEVYWHAPDEGYQPYFRGTITEVAYNNPDLT